MKDLFQSASLFAPEVDHQALRLFIISSFFIGLVFTLIVYFCVRYRKNSNANRENPPDRNPKLEYTLIAVIFIFGITTFWSSAKLYYQMYSPPENSQEIFGVAKQWLWIFHAPNGKDQINELTVVLNQPTKLTLISEDVIHSLYIPAFRVKQDVLPNRYTTLWFTPTKLGDFELFCTQFCGLSHSKMLATVHVVSGDANRFVQANLHPRGEALFQSKGCVSCHNSAPGDNSPIGPSLIGLYGQRVALESGGSALVDDTYLRESILIPSAKIAKGYSNLMPPYQGVLGSGELQDLVDYLKNWKVQTP